MLYSITKKLLFRCDSELIHNLAIDTMAISPDVFHALYAQESKLDLSVNLNGLIWKNPIGLAAGLDKNARAITGLGHLGFAAIEIGTVTKEPQLGNPRPRMFRYPAECSLRNSMGFPNDGSDTILKRLKNLKKYSMQDVCVGVNLGKNKDVSDEQAVFDQAAMALAFAPYCDYLVVNISSPNTTGLREWQQQEKLHVLLNEIEKTLKKSVKKPLFIKISPDLNFSDLASIVEVAKTNNIHGIIATNTTIMPERGAGGISGELLTHKAMKIRSELLKLTRDSQLSIIGVGGISQARQIIDFLVEGGDAVQIYSSLIFHGPGHINRIKHELCQMIARDNSKHLKEYLSKRRDLKWS